MAVAGLMASVCAGAAGCAGSGAAAEGGRGPEGGRATDPVGTLHRAADTLVGAGSSQARTSMEMATGGTRVTIRGEGVYDYRHRLGRLKVMLPQDPAGESRTARSPNSSRRTRCS